MKLENDNNSYGKFSFYLFASAMIAGVMVLIYYFIKIIINGEIKSSLFALVVGFLGIVVISVASYVYYDIIVGSMNIKRKYIKEIGEKVSANIISVGVYRGRGHENYFITVSYRGKNKEIYYIKNNMAYEILKLLLNPFPIKYEVNVPINIYIYKNKVYADLDSVDLAMVKGYEDAKKAVEEAWEIE